MPETPSAGWYAKAEGEQRALSVELAALEQRDGSLQVMQRLAGDGLRLWHGLTSNRARAAGRGELGRRASRRSRAIAGVRRVGRRGSGRMPGNGCRIELLQLLLLLLRGRRMPRRRVLAGRRRRPADGRVRLRRVQALVARVRWTSALWRGNPVARLALRMQVRRGSRRVRPRLRLTQVLSVRLLLPRRALELRVRLARRARRRCRHQ